MNRYCIVCGNTIPSSKRSDAQTCSHRCRIEKSKHPVALPVSRQEPEESLPVPLTPVVLQAQTPSAQLTAQQQQLLRELEELKILISQREMKLHEAWHKLETVVRPRVNELQVELRQYREELSRKQNLVKMNDVDFYNNCGVFMDRLPAGSAIPYYNQLRESRKTMLQLQNALQTVVYKYEAALGNQQSELNKWESYHDNLSRLVMEHKGRLRLLEAAFYGRPIRNRASTPLTRKRKALIPASEAKIVSGSELMHASLGEPVLLPGRLGAFLGRVERHRFFLALTGNAGGGKSELSFRLARIFTAKGLRVMYFSLEMGINEDVQNRVKRYGLSEGFYLRDEGKLADVKKEAARYDVIIVDSYGKLEADADEIDRLRNLFPQTFFIFIFQKTTTGTIRGGNKVIFDCTASIDLVKDEKGRRVATMTKSRYGTQGWQYLPAVDQVIKPSP